MWKDACWSKPQRRNKAPQSHRPKWCHRFQLRRLCKPRIFRRLSYRRRSHENTNHRKSNQRAQIIHHQIRLAQRRSAPESQRQWSSERRMYKMTRWTTKTLPWRRYIHRKMINRCRRMRPWKLQAKQKPHTHSTYFPLFWTRRKRRSWTIRKLFDF